MQRNAEQSASCISRKELVMKLYQTSEARQSAINNILELIAKINLVSGDQLDYIASRQTTHYLTDLIKIIEAEDNRYKKER